MSTLTTETDEAPVPKPEPILPAGTRKKVPPVRWWIAGLTALLLVLGAVLFLFRLDPLGPQPPQDVRGTPEWARENYGNADARRFRERNIVEIDFLGEPMYVHEKAKPHFLRLAQIFQTLAPEYAATIAAGGSDDWSYLDRNIRGEESKSNHAFGLALDINALENVLGTTGNMPAEVVAQWEAEGGEWGGDWSRPDPMHFETHLTPEEIRTRYEPDGTPRSTS